MSKTHYFTFGQEHSTSYPLAFGGRLADYYVAVELPENYHKGHREIFIEEFSCQYCPSLDQWGFEYAEDDFDKSYFPMGELLRITKTEGCE